MRGIPRYTLIWGARYTLGARYLSKNTVFGWGRQSLWVSTRSNRPLVHLGKDRRMNEDQMD